jgi:uncharacterized protein YbjQ (UPF0145 family)
VSPAGIRSLLAVRDEGFVSVGVVVGASTYQVLQPMGCKAAYAWGYSAPASALARLEYSTYIEGVTRTWTDAIDRLDAEATRVGAHGVVGVSARAEMIQNQAGGYQVQLIGTGVVVPGVAPLRRPFLSMLSLPDTVKLLLRGWIPTGVGVGVAAEHVHGNRAASWGQRGAMFSNAEIQGPTDTVNSVRRDAEIRLRKSATLGPAEVVVGTNIDVTISSDRCYIATGLKVIAQMTGTGVVRFGEPTVPIDAGYPLTNNKEKNSLGE